MEWNDTSSRKPIKSRKKEFIFIVLFLLFSQTPALCDEIKSHCNVSAALPGHEAELTCNFGGNIGKLKQDIQVVHLDSNGKETPILTCFWENAVPDCLVDHRYRSNCRITDTLHLDILKDAHNVIGNYSCRILGYDTENFEFCVFELKEAASKSTDIYTTNSFTKTTEKHENDDVKYPSTTIALSTLCAMLILILAIGVFFIIRRCRQERRGL